MLHFSGLLLFEIYIHLKTSCRSLLRPPRGPLLKGTADSGLDWVLLQVPDFTVDIKWSLSSKFFIAQNYSKQEFD